MDDNAKEAADDLTATGAFDSVSPLDDLPVEPPGAPPPGEEKTDAYEELLAFHLYGHRAVKKGGREPIAVPALLYKYRDLSQVRYDYPVCLDGSEPSGAARPLAQVLDKLLEDATEDGDAREQMRRNLYRLESVIKSRAEENQGVGLSTLWDEATAQLLASARISNKKKDELRDSLAAARQALDSDGEVVTCNGETPERLFKAAALHHWSERSAEWRAELDALILKVENILGANFSRSAEAKSPEHLRDSLGANAQELDEQAMSEILRSSSSSAPLPRERQERVQNVLSILRRVRPVFDVGTKTDGKDASVPFRVDTILTDATAAAAEFESRTTVMVEFFKSVRIARLETENWYRESVHDKFFEGFKRTHLTEEEFALFPPVLVKLTDEALADKGILLDLLGSTSPFKVLVQLDNLAVAGKATAVTTGWASRLAGMVMALSSAYVMQSPVSGASFLYSGFVEGFRYPGPALFSIYAGSVGREKGSSTYLRAAAATESRCFPVFTFNPGLGATLAERIDVASNPQADGEWPTDSFRYQTADGEEATVELAFTPADFLYADGRFGDHFWMVPPERWHENMVLVDAYFALSADEAAAKIPYIVTVDKKGRLGRVAMTRDALTAVAQCASAWKFLQETGGVNNSFAINALGEAREQLAEEKRREIEAIEKNYVDQLEQDIGELTKEIVQRIANQLMTGDGSSLGSLVTPAAVQPTALVSPAPAPAAKETAAAEVEQEVTEEEEEDEAPSFDDPYIDTPLCTTCNECTELNGQMFAYDGNKQAFIKNATAGPFSDLVRAAELCPVHIIHPGKPKNPDEPGQEEWIKRAAPFN